eukprot:m.4589 g.4589  ORF g.4589 m.4589 type:complete len:314 (+) comp5087_c0_seq1:2942-3883(+)
MLKSFNWLDMAHVVFGALVGLFVLTGSSNTRAVLSIAVYIRWVGLIYFLQAFENTGPLVRMLLRIIGDIKYIVLLLSLFVFGTAHAFYVVLRAEENSGFSSPGTALFTSFNMVLLGDFDTNEFTTGRFEVLLQILFVISMMLIMIVLLNLLIALMSDSYERIQDGVDNEIFRLRARLVLELEPQLGRKARTNKALYPTFLHVLTPQGKATNPSQSTRWQGVLHDLKSHMSSKQSVDEVHTLCKQNLQIFHQRSLESDGRIAQVMQTAVAADKKIMELDKKLTNTNTQLQQVLRLLTKLQPKPAKPAEKTEFET